MNKYTFVLLIFTYVLSVIYNSVGAFTINHQIIFCVAMVSLFGIPHGSIDHVLYRAKMKSSNLFFYSFYFGLILIYVLLWLFFPLISFIFFLILSAFHFGESQFENFVIKKDMFKYPLFFIYGVYVLSTLIYFNIGDLNILSELNSDTIILADVFNNKIISFTYFSSLILLILLTIISIRYKLISEVNFSIEIFTLILINLISYLFPFIIAFSLYFVLLHSIPVMFQEFKFLKEDNSNFNYRKFIMLLLPYTLVSLFFTFIIFYCSYIQLINISIPYLSMIIISVITLPHAIVMNLFYNK